LFVHSPVSTRLNKAVKMVMDETGVNLVKNFSIFVNF
jgi:hypothetical protein